MTSTCLSSVVSTVSFGYKGGVATLHVSVGDTFVVEAKTNPSTGYNWNLVGSIPSCLEMLSSEYISSVPQETGLVGAPSVLQITFLARSACSTQIQYVYNRAWEDQKQEDATMTINLSVRSSQEL